MSLWPPAYAARIAWVTPARAARRVGDQGARSTLGRDCGGGVGVGEAAAAGERVAEAGGEDRAQGGDAERVAELAEGVDAAAGHARALGAHGGQRGRDQHG
jgi:hypothetical protein